MTRAVVLLALALVAWPAVAQPLLSGKVTQVSDGDTVRLGEARVRLHGIDAPETAQTCAAAGREYRCGVEATRFLQKLIGDQPVVCAVLDADRYGRLIARCYLGSLSGLDLSRAMVSAGWAVAYTRYSTDYTPEQNRASAAHLGIWRGTFQAPEAWRKERGR